MKIHYKLYKSGKLWLTAVLVALSVMGVSQMTVNADSQQSKLISESAVKDENAGFSTMQNQDTSSIIEANKELNSTVTLHNSNGKENANENVDTTTKSSINEHKIMGEHEENGHWYYYLSNGEKATGFRKLPDNRVVYYNEDGQLQNGLTKATDGYTYYFDTSNGNMFHGEKQLDSNWYYFLPENGRMKIGFQRLPDGRIVYYNEKGQLQNGLTKAADGYTYYFDMSNGNMYRGEKQLNGHWYYFLPENGRMKIGFQRLPDGRIVYYNEKGQLQNGDVKMPNGDWYYFDPSNGNMAHSGLVIDKTDGTLKDFNNDGVRQSGKVTIDGSVYQFSTTTGSLLINGEGEHKVGNHWYLLDGQGKVQTGFHKVADGRILYYDPLNGQLVNGERQIDGDWYFFDLNNGDMAKGFRKLPDGRIVFYNEQGRLQNGERQINGDWYYFNPNNGNMAIGFVKLPDGRTVYYNVQGRMVHGWFNANGSWGDHDVHWADPKNGQVHSINYFSQLSPISAPEGCGAASLAMMLSGKGIYPGLRTLFNNLPQAGGAYSVAGFRGAIRPDALTNYAHNWDSGVRNIWGSSLSQAVQLVLSGHPILYWGWSRYESAYTGNGGHGDHIKLILGYNNGWFHIYDPCYYGYGEGSHGMNGFDFGANSWQP